jgi:hypothetical protein
MKLVSKKESSDLSLNTESMEFTIDTSNQMIVSILRDKLYSNKIGAVCREVSSNSRDANREAGRSETPIIISINQENDLLSEQTTISFKDNGVGISPERISSVFLKYGSSTKRDNNLQTGGFGIGAKTPFAYSNEFLIITVSDYKGRRIENIYQAAILTIDGKEVSQLIPISEEETEAETGTTIVVPIKSGDVSSFVKETLQATFFWDVQPIYEGFEEYFSIPSYINLIEGEGCRVIYGTQKSITNSKNNHLLFLVDGIFYSFNIDNLYGKEKYKDLSHGFIADSFNNYHYDGEIINPILEFKTGELTLSASREQIELLEENLDIIYSRYNELVSILKSEGEKMFNDKKALLEKSHLFNIFSGHISSDLFNKVTEEEGELREKKLNKYLKDIKIHKHINLGVEFLPTKIERILGEHYKKEFNLFRINNGETIKFTKNSLLKNVFHIDLEACKKMILVYKDCNTNYQKNETLINQSKYYEKRQIKETKIEIVVGEDGIEKEISTEVEKEITVELRKPILFLVPIYNDYSNKENFEELKNLFNEIDVEIFNYSEIEKAKVVRNTNATKVAKEKGIESLNVRRYQKGVFLKETMEISKNDKTILNIEGEKNIILTLLIGEKFNVLDRKNIDFSFIDLEERVLGLNKTHTLMLLEKMGYTVYVIQKEKAFKIKNSGLVISNVDSMMNDFLQDKEVIEDVKNLLKKSEMEASDVLHEDSREYISITTNETRRKFLELGGLKLEDYKILPSKEKTINKIELKKLNNLNATIHYALSQKLKENFKTSKFEGYLEYPHIEKAKEEVKTKFPLIHLLYNDYFDRSWGLSEYNSYDEKGVLLEEGNKFISKQISKMIDEELEKLK